MLGAQYEEFISKPQRTCPSILVQMPNFEQLVGRFNKCSSSSCFVAPLKVDFHRVKGLWFENFLCVIQQFPKNLITYLRQTTLISVLLSAGALLKTCHCCYATSSRRTKYITCAVQFFNTFPLQRLPFFDKEEQKLPSFLLNRSLYKADIYCYGVKIS